MRTLTHAYISGIVRITPQRSAFEKHMFQAKLGWALISPVDNFILPVKIGRRNECLYSSYTLRNAGATKKSLRFEEWR